MKSIFKSRTVWIATLQGVVAVLVVISTDMPELDLAGLVLLLKSVLDVVIRLRTNEKVVI